MVHSNSRLASAMLLGPSIAGMITTKASLWSHFLRELLQRGTWVQAIRVQRTLIRNAIGSIACAWAANACYSTGNFFSSKSSRDQSKADLVVANVVWCGILYAVTILFAHVPAMLEQHFIDDLSKRPSPITCVGKLARGASSRIIATWIVMFGIGALVAYISSTKEVTKFKLEFYGIVACNHLLNTSVMLTSRQIYFQETCEGRKRLERKQKRKVPVIAVGIVENTRVFPTSPDGTAVYRKPKFWRAYASSSPLCLSVILAGGYVHLLTQLRVVEQGSIAIGCFMAISTLGKIALQESAKYFVMKKRIRSIRVMCILVAVPTVLIDTQARIILLGTQNTGVAAVSTFGMAIVEIAVRATKAFLVTWDIRKRHGTVLQGPKVPVQEVDQPGKVVEVRPAEARVPSPTSSTVSNQMGFALWRHQRQAYHTAEINADMYAEYIAIGCSASILFFYGNHPHYSLLNGSISASDGATRRASQLKMLLLQVIVEVIVDYTSILLEITVGIEFDRIKGLGSFLAALFGTTAVINIIISAMIYLD